MEDIKLEFEEAFSKELEKISKKKFTLKKKRRKKKIKAQKIIVPEVKLIIMKPISKKLERKAKIVFVKRLAKAILKHIK